MELQTYLNIIFGIGLSYSIIITMLHTKLHKALLEFIEEFMKQKFPDIYKEMKG